MAIIAQIRNKKAGLGRILIDSRLEIHKEIITIGYDYRKRGLFRSYNIYNKKRAVIEVREVLLVTDDELCNMTFSG